MAQTWTQKQIASLSGASLDLYNRLIAQGVRPADALNTVRATYGTTDSAAADTKQSVNANAALQKLTSGQTLTSAEKAALNIGGTGKITGIAAGFDTAAMQPTGPTGPTVPVTPTGPTGPTAPVGKKVVNTYTDENGNVVAVYDDGTTSIVGSIGQQKKSTSAFEQFGSMLNSFGLGNLTQWAINLAQSPDAPETAQGFYLRLIETPQYKERFGNTNALRIKNGLKALTEGEIMQLEGAYKKTMVAYGLPASFYDQPADYQQFIANDLSASEVADRVQAANAFVKLTNPEIRAQLEQYYGIDDGALTAYALDPSRAQSILTSLASKNTAAIAAGMAGFGTEQAKKVESLTAEKTFQQQAQGFGDIAANLPMYEKLSTLYGGAPASDAFANLANIAFGGPGSVAAKEDITKKAKQEEATFAGRSGIGETGLGTTQVSGML